MPPSEILVGNSSIFFPFPFVLVSSHIYSMKLVHDTERFTSALTNGSNYGCGTTIKIWDLDLTHLYKIDL